MSAATVILYGVGCYLFGVIIGAWAASLRQERRLHRERLRRKTAAMWPAQDKYDRDRAALRLAQHYGATMKRPEGFTNIDGTGA